MTLLEKAKELGLELNISDEYACGCPWEHGFETEEESRAFCQGHRCAECYAREYKGTEEKPQTTIKDSGDRTQFFDTKGNAIAQRDMHAGKGRMDLLPWYGIMEVSKLCEEGAIKYGERNVDKGLPLHSLLDSGARHLAKAIAGENDEDHLRAAAWNLLWALQQRKTHPDLNDMPWAGGGEM